MRRIAVNPRANWQKKVQSVGLLFHSPEPSIRGTVGAASHPYWNESAYYELNATEVDKIEAATYELQARCLDAAQHIINKKLYDRLAIPECAVPLMEKAWEEEPPALYGRFDLAWDGDHHSQPKLLEYYADTPTSLVEAAVVQWYWLQECFPDADQFNSLHEKLVAKWQDLMPYVEQPVYFAHLDDIEDLVTITYLRDTAEQAGLRTASISMRNIGWDWMKREFVDTCGKRMKTIFKLYPWEGMLHDEFGKFAIESYSHVQWIEPIWKMLLSNKALLAILWELFPNHQNLVPAYLEGPRDLAEYVKKPLLSREGANIELYKSGNRIRTNGEYGDEGFVYQALAPMFQIDDNYAVIGSWMIDQEAAGIGIRESVGPITDNLSCFVPHLFR
jgi:glutathionylspermidine synthase